MTNHLSACRLAALVAVALAIPAQAAVFLTANYTGSFDAATTLDGSPLGSDTAFSISANFDPSSPINPNSVSAFYPITGFTLNLGGHDYVGVPNSDTLLYLQSGGIYAAGLATTGFSTFAYSVFLAATPPLDGAAPSPTVCSDLLASTSDGTYHLTLDGVPGGLTIHNFGTIPATFSITTAVPEPIETAGVIGLGLAAFAGWRRRKA